MGFELGVDEWLICTVMALHTKVGRPRKTWLESVEELEIHKEDVHDRNKWGRNVNVMKRKSNPIGKRTINR